MIGKLDGEWHFKVDPKNVGETEGWPRPGKVRDRKIVVPSSWQVVFEDLRTYVGPAWFERDFMIPAEARGRRVAVAFMGVDWFSKVWINGRLAGEHENGFVPFWLDISDLVHYGQKNIITVRVADLDNPSQLPYDSEWAFLRMSGIWRDCWIEQTGRTYSSDVYVVPDIDLTSAKIRVDVSSPAIKKELDVTLKLAVQAPDGKEFSRTEPLLLPKSEQAKTSTIESLIPIQNPQLWDLDHPALYELTVSILDRNEVLDSASTDFGMRKIDEYLAGGGTVLLIVGDPAAIPSSRTGFVIGLDRGSAEWPIVINRSFGLFSRIPFTNPLGWAFYNVYTRDAIAGLSSKNLPDLIAAGYRGWFWPTTISPYTGQGTGDPVDSALPATIAQFKYKRGRLVITTLDLLEPFLEDPVATIMLHDLIHYCGTSFQPMTALPLWPPPRLAQKDPR